MKCQQCGISGPYISKGEPLDSEPKWRVLIEGCELLLCQAHFEKFKNRVSKCKTGVKYHSEELKGKDYGMQEM